MRGSGVNVIYLITLLHFIVVLNRTLPYAPKPDAFLGALAEPTVAFLTVMRHLVVSANALNPQGVAGFYTTGS